jgi:hypothetical protein
MVTSLIADDPCHNQSVDVSYFAQSPDEQRRTVVSPGAMGAIHMRLLGKFLLFAVTSAPALFAASPLLAQGTVAQTVRTVLAVGRVTSVVDAPMHFKLLRVTLHAGTSTTYRGSYGTIFAHSGPDGAITGESRNELRSAGAIQEEPFGFVHTWSSPPNSRLILLLGNINQEGMADVIVVK